MIPLLLAVAAFSGVFQQTVADSQKHLSASWVGSPSAAPEPPHEYRNDALHLVYRYPVELRDPGPTGIREAGVGDRDHLEWDTQYGGEEKCFHTLLSAKTPEVASGTFTVSNSKQGPKTKVTLAPSGMVLLIEFDRTCVPTGTKDDDLLDGITSPPAQLLGMHPTYQQVRYHLDGHKVYFLAPQGAPDDAPDRPSANAAVSMAVEGHLLIWLFESDDITMLNRLLNSPVQFRDRKPLPLVPSGVGKGTPIKLVP